MKKIIFLIIFLGSLVAGCQKNTTVVDPPLPPVPKGIPTAKGTPIGSATTRTIGSAGGTINSLDSEITVIVPAGAVTENTEFSIHPITNTAPNGIGTSYLLLPEGKHFNQPISIQIKYTDDEIDGTIPEQLFLAYQDTAGVWNARGLPKVDTINKTITITSEHFSRWAAFANTRLIVDKPTVDFSEFAHLSVSEVYDSEDFIPGLITGYVPLDTAKTKHEVSNWKANSQGNLLPYQDRARYLSPPYTPTPNPVTISVQVTDGQNSNHSITLKRKIYVNDSYFEIVLNDNTNIYPFALAYATPPYISITGSNSLGNGGTLYLPMTGAGTYEYGDIQLAGVDINMTVGGLKFTDLYFTCNPSAANQTHGNVVITKWADKIGDYIEGTFSGDLVYQAPGSCSNTMKHMTGRFKAKRMQ